MSGVFKHRVRRHVRGTQNEKVCQGFSNTERKGISGVFKHTERRCVKPILNWVNICS